MLQTFKAVLQGNRLEWIDEIPKANRPVEVYVTVLEENSSTGLEAERGRAMAEVLEKLSAVNAFADIEPMSWQREERQDRSLPNRE